MSRTRERNRKIILGLIAVGLLAWIIWDVVSPFERYIRRLFPIGRDAALLITDRPMETAPNQCHFELIRANGDPVWTADCPKDHNAYEITPTAIVADDDRVYLQGYDFSSIYVIALDRSDGRELWRRSVTDGETWAYIIPYSPMLQVDSGRLIVTHELSVERDSPRVFTLTALNTATGDLVWPTSETNRLRYSENLTAIVVAPGRLFISDTKNIGAGDRVTDTGLEVDSATGILRRWLPIYWGHWPTPRGTLGLGLEGLYLIPTAPQHSPEPRLLLSADDYSFNSRSAPVGVYEDLAVIGLTPRVKRSDPAGRLVLVGVELATGTKRWELELPPHSQFVDFRSADGQLPRLLPVGIVTTTPERRDDAGQSHLVVVVDLQTGHEVTRHTQFIIDEVRVVGTRGTIFENPYANLTTFDVTTGDVESTLDSPFRLVCATRPEAIKFNQLWCHSFSLETPQDQRWFVIDLPSWTLLHENGDFLRR